MSPALAGHTETGRASWYGADFAGRPTANGEIFDPMALTAAHLTIPLGTRVRITNLRNGRSIVARINDRGPFVDNVILDCSRAVARKLGFLHDGVTRVRITCLDRTARAADVAATSRKRTSEVVLADASSKLESISEARTSVPAKTEVAAAEPASGFCVQIGAYRDVTNAQTQVRKANVLSVPAFVHPKKRLFHVLVGPFSERSHAVETQSRLQQAGMSGYVRGFAP